MKSSNWNSYFGNIENKYNLKMSKNKPIVIFLDGKDITKNPQYNLISENKQSFNDIFEQTIKYFSMKFECVAISGVDEVSFIFNNADQLKGLNCNKKFCAHEIVAIFAQNFYKYFNDRYQNGPIYWHCKCSNIPIGKINSYIKYRSLTILELYITYFLKKKQFANAGKIPLAEKKQICSKMPEYEQFKNFENGKLYLKGELIDLENFLNDKVIKLPEIQRKENKDFLNLENF